MKKIKIYYLVAIFVLLFFANKVFAAGPYWGYEEAPGVQTEICGYEGADAEALCNASLEKKYPGQGFKCTLSTTSCVNNTGYTTINPKKEGGENIVSEKKYKLLAPIGELKEIETTDIGDYINIMFNLALGLAAALAVIMIIIGGVEWMGTDSVFGKVEAKKRILSAILGLIIALAAFALLNTINPALLGREGLNVDQVEIEIEKETVPWTKYSSGGSLALCPEGFIDVPDGGSGKINVCKTIASDLIKLITNAKKEGIILSGYGSRSTEEQRQLRIENNCPDIENSPAEECRPPTARPGRSMHESGEAIDFRCNGKSMEDSGGRNSPCFKWLSLSKNNNLLKNLKSESWHWSTTGK